MVQIRCLSCQQLVELPAKICPHCKKSLSGVDAKYLNSDMVEFSKDVPSRYAVPVNRIAIDEENADADFLIPTTFENKAIDNIPKWVYVIAGLVFIVIMIIIVPILVNPNPSDSKKMKAKSGKEILQKPTNQVSSPSLIVPIIDIKNNPDEMAKMHVKELDKELYFDRSLEDGE